MPGKRKWKPEDLAAKYVTECQRRRRRSELLGMIDNLQRKINKYEAAVSRHWKEFYLLNEEKADVNKPSTLNLLQ